MNKKFIFAIIAVILLFSLSCKKKSSTFSYKVSALSDISVKQYSDTTVLLPIKITLADGKKEKVTIIPALNAGGIVDSVTTATADTFPFATTLYLRVSANVPGTYPVVLKTKSPSTDTQVHSFKVVVLENTDCAASLTGTYSGYGAGVTYRTISISASSNKLIIPTHYLYTIRATIDCSSGKLNIEPGGSAFVEILSGTGTVTSDSITVDYKVRTDEGFHGGYQIYNESEIKNVYKR